MNNKTIRLEVHASDLAAVSGVVRVTPEAEHKVRELCRATGLSVREVASQLIIQGADLVEIVEVP